MPTAFDRSAYVRAPIVNVATGSTLAFALVAACPKEAPALVKKSCARLRARAERTQSDLADRQRLLGAAPDDDPRPVDLWADRSWGALRGRLSSLALLDHDKYPRAARAAELEATLFPEGTEFLRLEYTAQSSTMAAILRRIDADGLAKSIDDLCGKEVLQSIREVQPRYEAMVRERLRRDNATGQNLADSVRAIQGAIVDYTTKLLSLIDDDDPSTLETVRVALLPIANYRDAWSRQGTSAGDTGEAPDTVSPEKGADTGASKPV